MWARVLLTLSLLSGCGDYEKISLADLAPSVESATYAANNNNVDGGVQDGGSATVTFTVELR